MRHELADLIEAFECAFRARVNRLSAYNQINVTPFQAKVLLLVEKNIGCSQQVIAEWLSRDKAQVARTVKELETLKLIYRRPINIGGRILKLVLTVEGELICRKLKQFRQITMEDMLYSISCEDQDRLVNFLSKVVKDLSEHSSKFDKPRSHRYEYETL